MSKRTMSKVLMAGVVIAWAAACSGANDEEPNEVQLAAANEVKNLPDFLKCLNDKLKKGDGIDKAVACLPGGCTITLVMSPSSAQPACAAPAGERKCQLPRVLLACGNPKFEPSFTLCPTSANGGMQRIEVCQGMDGTEDTEMADIAAFGRGFDPDLATLKQVLSMPGEGGGTKGCNAGTCHLHGEGKRTVENKEINTGTNGGLLSTRVAPRPRDVIFTTDPAVQAALKKAKEDPKFERRPGTKDEDLASICKCIDENKGKEPFTEESGKLALALCNALLTSVEGAGGRGNAGGTGGVGGSSGTAGVGGSSGRGGVGGAGGVGGESGEDGGMSVEAGSEAASGSGGFGGSLGVFDAAARTGVPASYEFLGF